MENILNISIESIKPDPEQVFFSQGIPLGIQPPERVKSLYGQAEKLFFNLADPIGIMKEISIDEFTDVFSGSGKNVPETPIRNIYPHADRLALFAFTLGERICREIEAQSGKSIAISFMLDSIASYCTDKASKVAQTIYCDSLIADRYESKTCVLLYSPGYCGWHISGQEKLFDYLKPGKIGISLTESFLMIPLKSISGVLIAGKPDIHRFQNRFPFCGQCKTLSCVKRQEELAACL